VAIETLSHNMLWVQFPRLKFHHKKY